jgi:uncharacterized protein YbaR (Trm112 family)
LKESLVKIIRCPRCGDHLEIKAAHIDKGEIESGSLSCPDCSATYAIRRYVPRLVDRENYSDSWGKLWTETGELLRDSATGIPFHYNALHGEYSGQDGVWRDGRSPFGFAEHLVNTCAEVTSVDMSNSVDVLPVALLTRPNLNVVQVDINSTILTLEFFDLVWMFQVLQHTPSPADTLKSVHRLLKDGGQLSFTSYGGARYEPFYYRVTRRMDDKLMWSLISYYVPMLVPIKYRFMTAGLPGLSRLIARALHLADPRNIYFATRQGFADEYVHGQVWKRSRDKDRLMRYVVVNTYDRITPKYTNSATAETIRQWTYAADFSHVETWGRGGVRAVATR